LQPLAPKVAPVER
jgi:hypothetical protein